jgi:hypothetical protein
MISGKYLNIWKLNNMILKKPHVSKKKPKGSWAPIILVTWEADIRRITVQIQPRQIVQETLS